MKLKKLLVGALSAALIFSSASFAFAAADPTSGELGGQGNVEGAVKTDFFKVELPTVANTDTTYNFILDPQELIKATDAANYTGLTKANFEDGATVFFKNSDSKYSSKSNALTATNLGSVDADITVEATLSDTVSGAEAIKFNSDSTFEGDTDTSMYLAMTEVSATEPAESAVEKEGDTTKATLTSKIDKNPVSSFEKAVENGEYVYKLKSDAPKDKTYSFAMTGKCNPAGDWTKAKTVQPKVLVTWEVAEATNDKAPSIATTAYTATANTPLEITVDLGAGSKAATGIESVTYLNKAGEAKTVDATTGYTYANSKVTLTAATIDTFVGSSNTTRTYKITFNDTAKTAVDIVLSK